MPEGQLSPVGDDAGAIPCPAIHARTPPAAEQAAVYGRDRDVFVTINNKAEGPAPFAALPPAEAIVAHAAAAR